MNSKQRAVLWLGIALIALNLVSKWAEIKGVIFSGSSSSSGSSLGGQVGNLLNPSKPLPPGFNPLSPITWLHAHHTPPGQKTVMV